MMRVPDINVFRASFAHEQQQQQLLFFAEVEKLHNTALNNDSFEPNFEENVGLSPLPHNSNAMNLVGEGLPVEIGGAAGVAAAAAALWKIATWATPKVVELFKHHHQHAHKSETLSVKWKKVELAGMKALQYGLPLGSAALIIWSMVDPSSAQAKQAAAIGVIILQFLATKRGNDVAHHINEVFEGVAGAKGFSAGMLAACPSLASVASMTNEEVNKIYGLVEQKPEEEKRWYQCFTDRFCCCCKGWFGSNEEPSDNAAINV